jgi:DNA-binding MarR family transcriptional regulator
MSNPALASVLALLRVHARIEEQFGNAQGFIHGLALKELLLLMHLAAAPTQRLSRIDLARRLHVSASTVTRMSAPLEKRGIVGRQADPRDARLAYVILLPAGQRLVKDARATLERSSDSLFRDRWSKREIATLAELLGRLTAGLPGDLA